MSALPQPQGPIAVGSMSAFDLEAQLVAFIQQLFTSYRLDNPTLNLAQASVPAHPIEIVKDPDVPPVSFDYTQRAQTLALKVAPRVVRGRVPRTVTGEINADQLPNCPAIIVQCVSAKVEKLETIATVRILVSAYDENPDSQGYQDALNMVEALAIALTTFGSVGINNAYVIVLPIDWRMHEEETFPHFIAELTTQWELPSGRPLPDDNGIIPVEHPEFKLSFDPALVSP